ncbi:MAG: hypothetical protein LBV67_06565, partial [Streptococcaceae bacterium]|nr:hypothetical protein [Streptococcaceae bacterium]
GIREAIERNVESHDEFLKRTAVAEIVKLNYEEYFKSLFDVKKTDFKETDSDDRKKILIIYPKHMVCTLSSSKFLITLGFTQGGLLSKLKDDIIELKKDLSKKEKKSFSVVNQFDLAYVVGNDKEAKEICKYIGYQKEVIVKIASNWDILFDLCCYFNFDYYRLCLESLNEAVDTIRDSEEIEMPDSSWNKFSELAKVKIFFKSTDRSEYDFYIDEKQKNHLLSRIVGERDIELKKQEYNSLINPFLTEVDSSETYQNFKVLLDDPSVNISEIKSLLPKLENQFEINLGVNIIDYRLKVEMPQVFGTNL